MYYYGVADRPTEIDDYGKNYKSKSGPDWSIIVGHYAGSGYKCLEY